MAFYEEVYPDAPWQLDDDRFDWQNLRNPLQSSDATEIWLLTEDGRIIGHNIFILYTLNIGERPHQGYCSTNLIVRPGLVGKGIGHKLIECNENRGGVAYAVGITHASTRAFVKRGWVPVDDARLFTQIINPGPNLRYVGMAKWKASLASPALKIFGLAHRLLARIRTERTLPDVEVSEIDRFDPAHDKLWRSFLNGYALSFDRNAVQLNYKYKSRTDISHSIFLFRKKGVPIGYGVCRMSVNQVKRIRLGRIVDLVADPRQGAKLISFMIGVMKRYLAQFNVDGYVGVAADDKIATAFRRQGFFLSRVQPAIIKENGFSVKELRQKYESLWYITLGDSDLDNYW